MIFLTTIKKMLDQIDNSIPFTSTLRLRCGHIRSIRVTPLRIKTKRKCKTDKKSNILNAKQHDSATSNKQLNQKLVSNNNLPFGNPLRAKHPSVTRFLYQNTRSLGLSSNSHTIETLCNAMYENDIAVGCFAEKNH